MKKLFDYLLAGVLLVSGLVLDLRSCFVDTETLYNQFMLREIKDFIDTTAEFDELMWNPDRGNDDWHRELRSVSERIKSTHDEVMDVSPPANLAAAHEALVWGMSLCVEATRLAVEGDLDRLTDIHEKMVACGDSIGECARAMQMQ